MDEREPPADGLALPDDPHNQQETTQSSASTVGEAFSTFYRRFFPTLVAFLMWQGAKLQDAAEIVQETMCEAYRYWSRIRNPEAWTRQVASRKLVRHIAQVVQEEEPTNEVPEHSSLLRLTNVAAWEQEHDILSLLDKLPPRQRQVMAWTLDGYKPSEIAAELRISADAARASLKKGRRTLAALTSIGDNDE